MKALSLTQPYAELVKLGIKMIETRSWKTDYRGVLYIHASLTRIPKASRDNTALMQLVSGRNLDFGKILCACELTDCVRMTEDFIVGLQKRNPSEYLAGVYAPGRYAWILKDTRVLDKPFPIKGRLGLWDFDF